MKLRTQLILTVLASILYKYSISLGDYSGFQAPPMYGDFEAQRHWLEITFNLDVFKWYWHDLEYWGLDYPPLTAYHSYLLGMIASKMNPAWVALGSSRGLESEGLKLFMRLTALATDLLIYTPAIFLWLITFYNHNHKSKDLLQPLFLISLASPSFSLIDHGHFQYNSAMLGLSLLSFTCFISKKYALGSFIFVFALGFKQMALFYALPVFFYLLGECFALGGMKGYI
jgi:alpha-1,3-glucosyltransferase